MMNGMYAKTTRHSWWFDDTKCDECTRGKYHECVMCDFQPKEEQDERHKTIRVPRAGEAVGRG
jgi:hypothetical protein